MKLLLIIYMCIGIFYATAFLIGSMRELKRVEIKRMGVGDYVGAFVMWVVLAIIWPYAWLVFPLK